jgi:lipopolysaccharide export system protein LptC
MGTAHPVSADPGPSAKSRRRGDWAARTRGTPLEALRYSLFVARMRRGLVIAAAVLLATVLVYTLIPRQTGKITMTYTSMGRIENDLAMIKPRLSGTDAKGNPFVITADAAIQDARNIHRARLENVQADMSIGQQSWVNASATKGFFDMDANTLVLNGGISMYSDSGYEIHTADGIADLKGGVFHGPHQVTGQGPLGNFRADRFEIDRFTRQMTLTGNVHMTMYARPAKDGK